MAQDYTCTQCGQSFTTSDLLQQHQRQMHLSGGTTGISGTGTGMSETGAARGLEPEKGLTEPKGTQGDVGREP